ncbi:Chromosome partition protein Smc [compost metagenome]
MAGKKQYEMSFELNGNIDPRLTRSFDNLSRDVTGLEKDLGTLRKAKTFDKLTQDANEAKGAFHDLRENAKEFGEIFDKTLQFTGAHKIITTIGDMFSNMVSEVGALDDSVHQMGASTGATVEEMAQFKDITQEIYRGNFGDGFNDIANALVNVQRTTKQSGDELERTTKNALILRDTFGYEVNESVRSADMLMRQFGLTSEQAYNLMAQGSQKGLDRTGELLDTINEFSPQFKTLGFTANEMFDFFGAGLDAGAWNLDKVGDLVKEFDNRLKDAGDTANRDALAELFAPPDLDKTVKVLAGGSEKTTEYMELVAKTSKETAKQLVTDLKAGGTKGSKAMQSLQTVFSDSEEMLKGLSNGSVKGADAFQLILAKLAAIDDPIQRQTLGIAIMGTQYEDLGQQVVNSLTTVNGQFDQTVDTMKQIEDVKYSSVTKDLQKLGRELMDSVVIPIGEDLMPVLQNLVAWASDNKDVIKSLALAVPAGMLTKNAVSMGKDFTKVGKSLLGTTGNVAKFGGAIGLLSNPIGWATLGVGALTTGVIAYKKHQEKAREELIHMGEKLTETAKKYDEVTNKAKQTNDLVWEYNQLSKAIESGALSSDDLAAKKQRILEVTKKLQELYPNTITQYEIENGLVEEKIGLLKQEADADSELYRIRLERDAASGMNNLPELEKELDELQRQNDALREHKNNIDTAKAGFKEYAAEYERIMQMDDSAAKNSKLEDLLSRVSEFGEGLGYQFETIDNLVDLPTIVDELPYDLDNVLAQLEENTIKLDTVKSNYEQVYDAQKKVIELDLGGKLEDFIKRYPTLSDEAKRSTDTALKSMADLEAKMDKIPTEKKINVITMYQEIGKMPTLTDINPVMNYAPMKQYADGGIANQPSIFGEAGPEIAIPLNNKPRSQGLLDTANRLIGRTFESEASSTFAPVYSPKIIIQGNADEQTVRTVLKDNQREWEQNMAAWQRQQARRNLG